ncbi:MAG: hypothetical protein WA484_09955 [Solirubrobacteraceae bacterium]
MANLISRRAIVLSGALATLMLLIALLGATHANAATIHACLNKKTGAVRVVSSKAKCKKSEKTLSWNSEGPAGKNGLNGNNGLNGASGSNGTNGQDLTSHTPLPSGQSESGFYAVGSGSSATGYVAEGISFSQPLATAIAANHVVYNTLGTISPHCLGFGKAESGYVCLYEAEFSGLSFYVTRDFALNTNAADKYGFALFFEVKAAGYAAGSWTVTAP